MSPILPEALYKKSQSSGKAQGTTRVRCNVRRPRQCWTVGPVCDVLAVVESSTGAPDSGNRPTQGLASEELKYSLRRSTT
jgi:hypothetical protein